MVEGHSNSRNVAERVRELALAEGWEVINARTERISTVTTTPACPDNVPCPEGHMDRGVFEFERVKRAVELASSPRIVFVDYETWNERGLMRGKFTVGCFTRSYA